MDGCILFFIGVEMNRIFIREKSFYAGVFRLVVPIVAMNAMSLILNFCDNFMLGKLGEQSEVAISAATIANQPFFLFSMIMFGSMSGAIVLTSQYWGKKDIKTINSIAGTTLIFLSAICFLFLVVCFAFPRFLMELMSDDEEVIDMSIKYMRIILLTFVPNYVTAVFSGVLRTIEKMKIPLMATSVGILTNIFFNYCLIFGKFGFPELGITGAAIATLIARIVEFGIVIIYIIFFEDTIKFTLRKMFSIHLFIIYDFFKYSIPVVANEFIWGFGVTIHASIIGHISKEQFAAYTISNMVERISVLTMIGFSTAACIIIGKGIGAGEERGRIMQYAKSFQGLALGFAVFTGLIIFLARQPLVNIFDISGQTKYYTNMLLIVVTVFVMFKTFNCVSVVGIFRGGGDTKTGMIIDTLTMYLFAIPFGAIMKFGFGMNVVIVYMCLISDEIIKIFLYFARVKGGKWISNITRDFEKLT